MLQMDLKRNTLLDTESEVVRKEENILCLCVCVFVRYYQPERPFSCRQNLFLSLCSPIVTLLKIR